MAESQRPAKLGVLYRGFMLLQVLGDGALALYVLAMVAAQPRQAAPLLMSLGVLLLFVVAATAAFRGLRWGVQGLLSMGLAILAMMLVGGRYREAGSALGFVAIVALLARREWDRLT